jgi:hypothetical protein
MTRNTTRTRTLHRTMAAAAVAVGINATMIGALVSTPTRGEALLLANNSVALPMMVGSVSVRSLKAGFEGSFAHAARDWRHAERNALRGLHHGIETVSATYSWLVNPAHPTC